MRILNREMRDAECVQLNCHNAWFGFSLTAAGDLDQDGYPGIEPGLYHTTSHIATQLLSCRCSVVAYGTVNSLCVMALISQNLHKSELKPKRRQHEKLFCIFEYVV